MKRIFFLLVVGLMLIAGAYYYTQDDDFTHITKNFTNGSIKESTFAQRVTQMRDDLKELASNTLTKKDVVNYVEPDSGPGDEFANVNESYEALPEGAIETAHNQLPKVTVENETFSLPSEPTAAGGAPTHAPALDTEGELVEDVASDIVNNKNYYAAAANTATAQEESSLYERIKNFFYSLNDRNAQEPESTSKPVKNVLEATVDSMTKSSAPQVMQPKIEAAFNAQLHTMLSGHNKSIWSIAYSHDSSKLATAGKDGSIRIWDTVTGKGILDIPTKKLNASALAFSPDDTMLAAAVGTTIRLYGQNGQLLNELKGHTFEIWSLDFSPNGDKLISSDSGGTVSIWGTQTLQALYSEKVHDRGVYQVTFSRNGERFASCSHDKSIKVFQTNNPAHAQTFRSKYPVFAIDFSHDDTKLASGNSYGDIDIWNIANAKRLVTLPKHKNYVWSLSYSRDGNYLLSGSYDTTVKVWDSKTNALLKTFSNHSDDVNAVAFAPDSKSFASGSDDSMSYIWHIQ
jgi:hypothetical protein